MREADVLKTKTCGECEHFLPDWRGHWECYVPIPLAEMHTADTDATDCKCFKRRGDDGE
jgi:hypothetical protein